MKILICLNPCFNGRYSQRMAQLRLQSSKVQCLNPCFNGRYSQRDLLFSNGKLLSVLILVLMEDTLRDEKNQIVGDIFIMS